MRRAPVVGRGKSQPRGQRGPLTSREAMHSHAGLAGYHSSLKPRATPHGPSTAAEEVGQPPHRLTGRPTAHRATSDSLAARRAAEDELGDLGEGGVVGRVEVAEYASECSEHGSLE